MGEERGWKWHQHQYQKLTRDQREHPTTVSAVGRACRRHEGTVHSPKDMRSWGHRGVWPWMLTMTPMKALTDCRSLSGSVQTGRAEDSTCACFALSARRFSTASPHLSSRIRPTASTPVAACSLAVRDRPSPRAVEGHAATSGR